MKTLSTFLVLSALARVIALGADAEASVTDQPSLNATTSSDERQTTLQFVKTGASAVDLLILSVMTSN